MIRDPRNRDVSPKQIPSRPSDADIAGKHMRAVALVEQARSKRPSDRDHRVLSFPPFRLDTAEERLWKNGQELRLRPKPFAILRYLTRHPRRLVTQSEIVAAVWGKIAMSDSVVRTHVFDLRHVLGENLIETVLGRGYRFLADVSASEDAGNGKGLSEGTQLDLLRSSESPSPGRAAESTQALPAALQDLTDTMTTFGIKATILLIVGDEQCGRAETVVICRACGCLR
jgi:DNA-binding winged helix-turn-helix (wHTH) protein